MDILLLEDDHLQAAWIVSELEREFGAALSVVRTELEFRDVLAEFAASPPDVAILDVIVRWTDPAPDMRQPIGDARQGPKRAGVRCARLLREQCPDVPIVLYTILERIDLENDAEPLGANLIHLPKESRAKPLFDRIRFLTQQG